MNKKREDAGMALIKCPECGKEDVSDTAKRCPNCGFNIKKYIKPERKIDKKVIGICVAGVLAIICVIVVIAIAKRRVQTNTIGNVVFENEDLIVNKYEFKDVYEGNEYGLIFYNKSDKMIAASYEVRFIKDGKVIYTDNSVIEALLPGQYDYVAIYNIYELDYDSTNIECTSKIADEWTDNLTPYIQVDIENLNESNVVLKCTNKSNYDISAVHYNVVFYDENGNPISHNEDYASDDILKAGQSCYTTIDSYTTNVDSIKCYYSAYSYDGNGLKIERLKNSNIIEAVK